MKIVIRITETIDLVGCTLILTYMSFLRNPSGIWQEEVVMENY